MLCSKDVKPFLKIPSKLVKKNDFVLYGHIESISENSLIFETTDGIKSVIILEAIKEIVQRPDKRRYQFD